MTIEQNPTEHVPVRDLKSGDQVFQYFMVKSKNNRTTRTGQEYLDLVVGDASGSISAKMWSDIIKKWGKDFSPGDIIKIVGRVETFRNANQLLVEKARRVAEDEQPNFSYLIRSTEFNTTDLFNELVGRARSLNPPELANFVVDMLDQNHSVLETCPAAKMVHHAYKGGLIEHIVTVARKVDSIADLESEINRDIAVAGAMLHDIGKLQELATTGDKRTTEGRLLGHLILGVCMVRDLVVHKGLGHAPWLPELLHILVSHHGGPEFGSPVRPMTREAMLVHFVDNLDSRLKIMHEALESIDSEGFSEYNRWLQAKAYIGAGLSDKEDNHVGD